MHCSSVLSFSILLNFYGFPKKMTHFNRNNTIENITMHGNMDTNYNGIKCIPFTKISVKIEVIKFYFSTV